jgi:uncharacterized protein YuzE
MIQTTYDPEADAMAVWFAAPGVVAAATEEAAPGVMLDFDGDGQVIGIEVLGVRQRMSSAQPTASAQSAAE